MSHVLAALMPISIHALREEGDERWAERYSSLRNFYPRPPRGGRLCWRSAAVPPLMISIHALREEGDDAGPARLIDLLGISIHALREEGDRRHRPARRLQYDCLVP